jgi:peptidoglycan hydrolase-like protein with peptidoglycan-binding domain
VRRAQEELRKRHLFFGETTGQPSPALTAAIGHYQKKKGFSPTGTLDPETCGSLGISASVVSPVPVKMPTPIPFVLANSGEARGPNGEALPVSLALSGTKEDRAAQFDHLLTDRDRLVLTLLGSDYQSTRQAAIDSRERSRVRSHRVAPPKEKNPFVVALWSMDHAMKRLLGEAGPTKKKNAVAKRL